MRATVALLNNAPTLAAPRAFVLSENQVLAAGGKVSGGEQSSFWSRWLPRLMPVATAVIAILFIFSFAALPSRQMGATPANLASSPEISMDAVPAEMPAEEAVEMGIQAVERPAPPAAPSQARSLDKNEKEVAASAPLAEEPVTMQAQNTGENTLATSDEGGMEMEKGGGSHPETPSPPSHPSTLPSGISLTTWLLGSLLIIFLFLTWRVTFARSPKK